MKKIFLVFAAMIVAANAMALDRNIFASGLKAAQTTEENTVDIQYILNAPAIALEVQFLDADNKVVTSIAITDEDKLSAGEHTATLDLSTVPGGSYKWAIKAQGVANPAPDDEEDDPILEQVNAKGDVRYIFYNPQGVVVDNSFESDYFGRVYVSDAMSGDEDGATPTSQQQQKGLFIYNQLLDFVYEQNNVGFTGGVNFRDGRQGMRRLEVDDEGWIFMCDGNVDVEPITTGVWMANPADPTQNFTEILDLTLRTKIYTRVCSAVPDGVGNDRVLYVLDNMKAVVRFPIGFALGAYASQPDTIIADLGKYNLVNSEITMRKDGKGGFWFFQNRGQIDEWPMCVHFNKSGELDFQISEYVNADIAPSTGFRGAGDVSVDGKYMAFGGAKSVALYEVTWAGATVKEVKPVKKFEFPNIGTCIDGIAFDVANNVYVVSATSEYMHVFALPTVENTFVTPAKAANTIESKTKETALNDKVNVTMQRNGNIFNINANAQILSYTIFSVAGQMVQQGTPYAANFNVDLSNLQQGAYMMQIRAANGQTIYKFIK